MDRKEGQSSSRFLLYGGLSAIIARTLTAPLERAKILQQASPSHASVPMGLCADRGRSLSHTLRFMAQSPEPLLRSLWRGNLLNLSLIHI